MTLLDYGRVEGLGLVGIEVNDGTNPEFVFKVKTDDAVQKLGVVSFGAVSIQTFEGAERSQIAEAFSRSLTTPNVLESTTRQRLRDHHNWSDVVELTNRYLPTELQVA